MSPMPTLLFAIAAVVGRANATQIPIARTDGCDICPRSDGTYASESPQAKVSFQNTSPTPITIYLLGVCCAYIGCDSKVPCLTDLQPNTPVTVALEKSGSYAFSASNPYLPNKSLFEMALCDKSSFEMALCDIPTWDISFNAGFDYPVAVVTPTGVRHVASTKDSPDAYPYVDPDTPSEDKTCTQIQPCEANNYPLEPSATTPYQVTFGPYMEAGELVPDSPSKFGCSPSPGFECDCPVGFRESLSCSSVPYCTTSMTEEPKLYCWQGQHGDCSAVEVKCYEGGSLPGSGSCPSSCPLAV